MGSIPRSGKSDADHRMSENALEESEQRSSAILNAASESIWLLNLAGDILAANATAAQRLGSSVSDVVGKNCFDLLPPDVGKLRKSKIDEMVATGKTVRFEDTRAGIIFDHTFYPVRDAQEKITGLAIFSRDITVRKRTEQEVHKLFAAVQEEKDRLASVLNSISDEVWFADNNKKFILANPSAVREFGVSSSDNIGVEELAEKLDVYREDGSSRPINEAPPLRALTGEVIRNEEEIIRTPGTGMLRHRLVSSAPVRNGAGAIIGSVSVVRDITERKRAEEALCDSEERFKVITETTPVGIGVVGVPDGKFLYVNSTYQKKYGYAEGELLGKGTPDIYWGPEYRESVLRILREKGSVTDHEVRFKHKDGTPFWGLASVRPITYDGRPALLGAFVDITERKRIEEKLEKLNRTLGALGKSSQAMMHAVDEADYLKEVCRIIVQECGHTMAWIGFANDDEEKTVVPVCSAGFENGYLEKLNITWADTERGHGPTGTAIRTGKVSICRNMLIDPVFIPWREEAIKRGYASSIVLPLMGETKAFGAISIYSKETDPFSKEEEHLLTELAQDLAHGTIALRLRKTRAETEESLRTERNFINSVLQTTAGLIIGLDLEGRIQIFNHACEKTTGYLFNEVKGRVFWDFLLLQEEREPVKNVFGKIKEGVLSSETEFENYWVTKDGRRRYIKWANSAIKKKDGGVQLVIGTGIDITERKVAEGELKKQSEELRATNEDLTRFNSAAVNRELRMVELKKEMNQLCARCGEPPRYPLAESDGDDATPQVRKR